MAARCADSNFYGAQHIHSDLCACASGSSETELSDDDAANVQLMQTIYNNGRSDAPLRETARETIVQPSISIRPVPGDEHYKYKTHSMGKVVLLGSSGVGKTQFLLAASSAERTRVVASARDLHAQTVDDGRRL